MILIAIMLLFSLYLFWYFDRKRKLRHAEHQRQKREAFMDLLHHLIQKNEEDTNQSNKRGEDK